MAKRNKSAPSKKSQSETDRDSGRGGLILQLATLALVIGLVVYLLVTGFTDDGAASTASSTDQPAASGTANGAAQASEEALPPAPVEFDPPLISFGDVRKNTMLTRQVKLTNHGSAPVRVIDTRPSCPCTTVQRSANTISPGGSISLDIEMDSESRVGPKNVNINVLFAGYEPMRVPINANVVDGPA